MPVTFEMPTLEPSLAGFTKHGTPIPALASSASTSMSWTVCALNVTLLAHWIPAAASTVFTLSLSIVSADARTPEPT